MTNIIFSKNSATKIAFLFVSMLALGGQINAADARVIVKEKKTYYNVKGSTGEQIFKSIRRRGPRLDQNSLTGGGGHAIATAEFSIEFTNVKKAVVKNRCRVSDLDIILNVKYTFPRWRASKSASKKLRKVWKQFDETVKWHERQHTRIAKDYAEKYEKIIRKTRFKAKTNCDEFTVGSAFRVKNAALRSSRQQRNFDRRDLKRGGRGYKAQKALFEAR